VVPHELVSGARNMVNGTQNEPVPESCVDRTLLCSDIGIVTGQRVCLWTKTNWQWNGNRLQHCETKSKT